MGGVVALSLSLLQSCKKDEITNSTIDQVSRMNGTSTLPIAADGEPMVLGEQFNNPYTVQNMQEALNALSASGELSENPFEVRITHRYIKYTPSNEAEYDALISDSNLVFYDYPLDHEIVVQGNFYHDSSIPDTQPTPQYVVVPDGYSLNTSISHDILAELYIPEEDKQLLGEGLNENLSFGKLLLEQAFNNAGTFFEPFNPWEGSGGGSSIPQVNGTIRTYDTRLNQYIPLQGVEVTARRNFTTRKGTVSANGTYSLSGDPFNRSANYTIHFERNPRFKVMNSTSLNNAKIVRNNISGNTWNYDIADGLDCMHATMFRAAYHYYFKNIGGLNRPSHHLDNVIKIISKSTDNLSNNDEVFVSGKFRYWILGRKIKIARYQQNSTNERISDQLFSTTIHELAHYSHYNIIGGNSNIYHRKIDDIIAESWATAIQWQITSIVYNEYRTYLGIANLNNYGKPGYYYFQSNFRPITHAYQYWNPHNYSSAYTSLFINIIDDYNELNEILSPYSNGSVDDRVKNYTLSGIESYLDEIYTLDELTHELKQRKPFGISDSDIDLLINHYR